MSNRIITTLFAVFCLSHVASLSLMAQGGLRPRGDVNCDWEVNITDLNSLVDSVIKGTSYHPLYSYTADVNDDKEINIADINMVIDAILGKQLLPMPSFSGTLPVLYINTEGYRDIVSKEEYLNAYWWLDNMGIEGCESIGSAQEPQGMQIRGRGNYTWTKCDKKQYRIKLDRKYQMLGMPSSRHWVLKGNAFNWKGQIEDVLPFEIGRRMGMAWNPHIEPVEVVLNGQYIGLYFLYEHIRVAHNRVNITEQEDYEIEPERVTGGWLLEINNYDEPDNIVFTEGNGRPFWVMPHSPENLSGIQYQYIISLLKNANSAIYNDDKESREWEQYIDIDSLAIYYLVQETVDNPEAFSGSCFFHKERGNNTKLIFGPLWDCDHSFYRSGHQGQTDEFIYEDVPNNWYCRWISEIVKYPRFQERVIEYWNRFYTSVYPQLDDFIDTWATKIEKAGNADYVRWPQYNNNNISYRINHYGRRYFHKKVDWLKTQWGSDAIRQDSIAIQ